MAEAARVAVQAMAVAGGEISARHEGTQNVGPNIGGPMMKQLTFKLKAEEKYNELKKSD